MREADWKFLKICRKILPMLNLLDIREGVTFGGMKDFDVSNIVKDILWKKNAESVILKVKKDIDDCHVYIEIKEINK